MEPAHVCGNPFCKAALANRYARFCEDKPLCQRYRALKLQCQANAQAEEDEEDTQPLSHVVRRRRQRGEEKEKSKETFAIPRRKKAEGKRRLDLSAAAPSEESSSSSPRQKSSKRLRRARSADEAAVPSNASSTQRAEVSSAEEVGSVVKHKKKRRDPRASEVESDGSAAAAAGASKTKKRRLNRHASADDALTRSASSSPVSAASDAATWTIPRARPGRTTTAAQEIRKNMSVGLVPLGVASQSSTTGGGRYVQNGNRSAAQALRPPNPRPRPPTLSKFTSPAAARRPPATTPTASTRPVQPTQSTAPAPPQPQVQAQLPPLAPAMSRPIEPARAVTPLSSPVKRPVVASATSTTATTATRSSGPQRISASDYMKKKKGDHERQPGHSRDRSSRSSSLERSSSFTDAHDFGLPPAPAYPPGPPGYHRSDSAPLPVPSYRESRPIIDPRRQYAEADGRPKRPSYDVDGSRMEYRDRSEGRNEPMLNDRPAPEQWETRNFPPPRDRYPPRPHESSSFATDGVPYEYAPDPHLSPASSPREQPYWRKTPREELPLPPAPRAPSPRRDGLDRPSTDRRAAHDEFDEDPPSFSYHEEFLPRLLSIFIHKLPQALEAVFNVTKKPRKMNWYLKYCERIERLCQPYDLRIKIEGQQAIVTVRGREWLTLRGTSTVTLYKEIITGLRAEAMTWLQMFEEMEKALAHYQGMYGSKANESYSFLRAWNELKAPGNYITLERQTNYFCGARLHHWNFVVGKVEIGSGSHEEKREAFRLATLSALDFLLSVGRGVRRRRSPQEVKRERVLDADAGRRSSSRESSVNSRVRVDEQANGVPAESFSSAGESSSAEPSSATQTPIPEPTSSPEPQSSTASTTATPFATEPQSSAEPSSSPVTVERAEKPSVAIIPTTEANGRREVADDSDPGEEMSISGTTCQTTRSAATVELTQFLSVICRCQRFGRDNSSDVTAGVGDDVYKRGDLHRSSCVVNGVHPGDSTTDH
jgi:hypothetical protein